MAIPPAGPGGQQPTLQIQSLPVVSERRVQARFFGQELVRASLALLFAGLLITIVVLGYSSAQGPHWASTKEWLQAVLPAVTGLLGSAVGFYFGTRKTS